MWYLTPLASFSFWSCPTPVSLHSRFYIPIVPRADGLWGIVGRFWLICNCNYQNTSSCLTYCCPSPESRKTALLAVAAEFAKDCCSTAIFSVDDSISVTDLQRNLPWYFQTVLWFFDTIPVSCHHIFQICRVSKWVLWWIFMHICSVTMLLLLLLSHLV